MTLGLFDKLILVISPFLLVANFNQCCAQELEIFAADDFIDPSEWQSSDAGDVAAPDKFLVTLLYGGFIHSSALDLRLRGGQSEDKSLEELYNVKYFRRFAPFFRTANNFYFKDYQLDWKFTVLFPLENEHVNYNNKLALAWYTDFDSEDQKSAAERLQFTWDLDRIGNKLSHRYSVGLDIEEIWGSSERRRKFANFIYSYRPDETAHYMAISHYVISSLPLWSSRLAFNYRISGGGIGGKWRLRPYRLHFLWDIPVDFLSGSIYLFWSPSFWLSFKANSMTFNSELGIYIGTPIRSWLF